LPAKRAVKSVRKPAAPPPLAADFWLGNALAFLQQRQSRGALGDCPLPELFREARTIAPTLSIGQFHDGLRTLHTREQIYLHPWTGPLYGLPEPTLALLVGHEVAYYASPRNA
jgi:hypothetical protein